MTSLSFPELDEIEGKIAQRVKSGGDFTAEAKVDGVLDLSRVKSVPGTNIEKANWFKNLQDELSDLNDQALPLRVLKAQAERARRVNDGGESAGIEPGDGSAIGSGQTKSVGEVLSTDTRRLTKNAPFEVDVELKTVLSTTAGWAPDVVRGPRMVDFATRPLELLDFIPTVPTNQTSVAFMEETTYTNAAVETAEGAAKPEAALGLTERTSVVRKIAVILPVTDEQLEDVPRVREYINNRLPFMVRQRLSSQILVGDGAGVNLRGILNTVGIQTQAKGADPTPDAIYKAMVLIMTTGQAMPDAVVINPLDWQDIRLLRTADGLYIWGNPSDAGPERIWGLPALLVQAETQNTALVGAFKQFSELDVKKGLVVETGYVNDDFSKNKQTLRAEIRVALCVFRPTAFCTVTGI